MLGTWGASRVDVAQIANQRRPIASLRSFVGLLLMETGNETNKRYGATRRMQQSLQRVAIYARKYRIDNQRTMSA